VRHFYALLLRLYPSSFRAEYGGEMRNIFARRIARSRSVPDRLFLAVSAVADVLPNATRVQLDILRQDLRHTARALRRSPGFAVTVVLVAALGIGATTATYSILDRALIRPLPFAEPDRLVRLWEDQPFRGSRKLELSPPNFRDWKRRSRSFEAMGATMSFSANLVGGDRPRRLDGERLTFDVLPLLGARPALGRIFSAEDDRGGAAGTVVLSDALWRNRFAADPSVIGRTILLDDEPFTVIGIMPPGFSFPGAVTQFWTAMRFTEADFQDRTNYCLKAVARLRRGVSLDTARSEMNRIAADLERDYPRENGHTGATVVPLHDRLTASSRLLVTALFGAALGVLLISCTNLANLLLCRGLARRRELAVRAALGAGRERLFRQLLTESVVLALGGGAVGVGLAVLAAPLLGQLVPGAFSLAGTPPVDARILGFAAALTMTTGIGFGILPAFGASRNTGESALQEDARSGIGRRSERLRSALVVLEITLSVALLAATGLMIRALQRLQGLDPGFRSEGVLTLATPLPLPRYAKAAVRQALYDRVLSETTSLSGVQDAGYVSFLPMVMRGGIWPLGEAGRPPAQTDSHVASLRFVTPGFFPALRIPLKTGRMLSESDAFDAPRVAVVSESFARQNFGAENPLGRRFRLAFEDREIVGVVGDVRVRGFERPSEPQVYLPYRQMGDDYLTWYIPRNLVVRASVAPAMLLPALSEIVAKADPQIPVSDVRTLSDIVAADTAPRRLQAGVLAVFAASALLLAGIGIQGVMAFAVSQRSREIGIRVALGAQPRDVLRMVATRGLALAASGVVLGTALACGAGRAMQALLAGVSPADGPALLAAAGLALVMTVVGCFGPVLRAVQLDPVSVIRSE
jgi:predicted permease